MAEDKTSFVLYTDQRGIFDKLNDEQAGKLIKHIFAYVNDEQPEGDFVTELAFESIMRQLKRDLSKWDQTREGRSKAGKASAEARRIKREQEATNPTSVDFVVQEPTNPTVTATVTVTDNVNDINNNTPTTVDGFDWTNLLALINKTFGREFKKINEAVRQKYKARIKEGYTKEDITNAMNNCKQDPFHKDNNYKHCTPEYFSRSNTLDLHSAVQEKRISINPSIFEPKN